MPFTKLNLLFYLQKLYLNLTKKLALSLSQKQKKTELMKNLPLSV